MLAQSDRGSYPKTCTPPSPRSEPELVRAVFPRRRSRWRLRLCSFVATDHAHTADEDVERAAVRLLEVVDPRDVFAVMSAHARAPCGWVKRPMPERPKKLLGDRGGGGLRLRARAPGVQSVDIPTFTPSLDHRFPWRRWPRSRDRCRRTARLQREATGAGLDVRAVQASFAGTVSRRTSFTAVPTELLFDRNGRRRDASQAPLPDFAGGGDGSRAASRRPGVSAPGRRRIGQDRRWAAAEFAARVVLHLAARQAASTVAAGHGARAPHRFHRDSQRGAQTMGRAVPGPVPACALGGAKPEGQRDAASSPARFGRGPAHNWTRFSLLTVRSIGASSPLLVVHRHALYVQRLGFHVTFQSTVATLVPPPRGQRPNGAKEECTSSDGVWGAGVDGWSTASPGGPLPRLLGLGRGERGLRCLNLAAWLRSAASPL